MNIQYKFLSGIDLSTIFAANEAAFSDYLVPMDLTKENFRNHLIQNAVDLSMSVGAFDAARLVGYTLNGFDDWDGVQTAYDAGTGVIPEFRKHGIGTAMFEFMLPTLKQMGTQQVLLEVLSNNEKAIKLYRKIGFAETRMLNFFEQTETVKEPMIDRVRIESLHEPDWNLLKEFWDAKTSWQFSQESFKRSIAKKKVFGAFSGNECVGYAALFSTSGSIAQIAISRKYRLRKVASMLVAKMQSEIPADKKLRFSNVDRSLEGFGQFTKSLKFKKTISQSEMVLKL